MKKRTTIATVAGTTIGMGTAAVLRALGAARANHDREWDNPLLRTPVDPTVVAVRTRDGARLRVHMYGPTDGEPIVLSHGWTCCIEYWSPQINVLARKYRVIAYDQRGHGRSESGSDRFGPAMLADDLACVLDATIRPGEKAVLVGHSMGGMSIMAWAGAHPEQVDRYAHAMLLANTASSDLISKTVIPIPSGRLPIPQALSRAVLGTPVATPPHAVIRRAFQLAVMSPTSTVEEVDFCFGIVAACRGRIRGRWGSALSHLDITAALDSRSVPTTVLAGRLDRLTPPRHSRKLAAALASNGVLVRFDILPGVGHMSNIEATDHFNDEIVRLRTSRTFRSDLTGAS
ncbi:alpha/beta fold hydrolase [Antrihabitans cavernicola]|uniref:Alpha/beta hydrolase n=1 Tax=Antrihabitans cavernicola TaxID=2495913 RepID=A0A5A7S3X4_9NOCA|nr:alpha/beta hydrolase [Spelaeibacter cavernicola]KAA0017681.1 alpha/beta hydrolase [Spelaeibacter cavernicola]